MRRLFSGGRDSEAPDARLVALKRKLSEVEAALEEAGPLEDEEAIASTEVTQPVASGPTDRVVVKFPGSARPQVVVTIGTSKDSHLADRIADIVFNAYTSVGKNKCVDREDALERLEMGDDGVRANRVLHLAWLGDEIAGCASSTFSPGWTPESCGHWGLMAVDPAFQGRGIATALVLAAERRLATVSAAIQIEYQYCGGDEFSERLMKWYEEALGFDGGPKPSRPGSRSFRRCFKVIPEDEQRKGHRRRLHDIHSLLKDNVEEEQRALEGIQASLQHL